MERAIAMLESCKRRRPATQRLLADCETDLTELATETRAQARADINAERWQQAAYRLALVARNRCVAAGLAPDEHLAMIRGGRRVEAIGALRHALAAQPTDGDFCHTLAIASYYAAADGAGRKNEAPDHRSLLGSFAMILHHSDWWDDWSERCTERFGAEVTAADLAAARSEIEGKVTALLTRNPATAPHWERWFQRERLASARIAAAGGIPTEWGGVVCGPWMVRELGLIENLTVAFQDAAAGIDLDDDDDDLWSDAGKPSAGAAIAELRALFSGLGIAQAALSNGHPDAALAALDDLACAECRTDGGPGDGWQPRPCRPSCPEFAAENPWHGRQRQGRDLFVADACRLRADVLLRLAQNAMTAAPMDAPEAARHLGAALELAGQRERVRGRVRSLLAGRVKALGEKSRLDDSIALLDACAAAMGDDVVAELHAEVLTDRGVRAGNTDPPAWDDAIRDLRRATRLNAQAARAVLNLGIAMKGRASVLWNDDSYDEAIAMLREAHRYMTEARDRFPGRPEVASGADDVAGTLASVVCDRAISLANDKRFDDAIRLLGDSMDSLPDATTLEQLRAQIQNGRRAHRVIDEMGGEEALRLQQQAVSAFNDDRPEDAIPLLRKAIKCSRKPQRLHADLARVLAVAAVARINGCDGVPELGTCRKALAMLREAVTLDRSNKHAKENLAMLERLVRQLEQGAVANASVAEYGGPEAMALQQQAVKAFNADRKAEAVRLLRRAIQVATREDKLQKELAMVLTSAAVEVLGKGDWSEAQEMLAEAARLDPDNDEARMMLMLARRAGR